MAVYYTQVGYISMLVEEDPEERLERVQQYVELFASKTPQESEIAAFIARNMMSLHREKEKQGRRTVDRLLLSLRNETQKEEGSSS